MNASITRHTIGKTIPKIIESKILIESFLQNIADAANHIISH